MKRRLNRKIMVLLLAGLAVFSGCSDSVSVFKAGEEEVAADSQSQKTEVGADTQSQGIEESAEQSQKTDVTEELQKKDAEGNEEKLPEKEAVREQTIFVDVCGAVNAPGVYQLPAGSRIFQAVDLAGGFREDAALELVNQAEALNDGQQIRIFTQEEARQQAETGAALDNSQMTNQETDISGENNSSAELVNLNRADKSALMTLTGIGETRAEAILAYRETHGGFSAVEELMQVEGIKEKTYEKLKDKITVD
ncbi:MAG: helix-hairpin-helix domain-containing protein [Bacillota bacterium]|nr:helix-hairpin-helix domain-containing protein [Bacillota bacterium]